MGIDVQGDGFQMSETLFQKRKGLKIFQRQCEGLYLK